MIKRPAAEVHRMILETVPSTQAEMCARTGLSRSTVTRAVSCMISMGTLHLSFRRVVTYGPHATRESVYMNGPAPEGEKVLHRPTSWRAPHSKKEADAVVIRRDPLTAALFGPAS